MFPEPQASQTLSSNGGGGGEEGWEGEIHKERAPEYSARKGNPLHDRRNCAYQGGQLSATHDGGRLGWLGWLTYLHGLVGVVVHRCKVVPNTNPFQEACGRWRQRRTSIAVLAGTRRCWPTLGAINHHNARTCHHWVGSFCNVAKTIMKEYNVANI